MRRLFALSAALLALIALSVGLPPPTKGTTTLTPPRKRALLQTKLKDVDFTDESFGDVINDLKDMVPGLHIKTASDGTIKLNHQLTFKAKEITLADLLDQILGKLDWGYIVISQKGNAYDGSILIRVSKERGYPADKDK